MSLGRLEIKATERAEYPCSRLKCDVYVDYRHPTAHDLARAAKKQGVSIVGNEVKLSSDDELDNIVSAYEGMVHLGELCTVLVEPEKGELPEGYKVPEEVSFQIGRYLQDSARLKKEEGEVSAPQLTGDTPES